MAKDMLAPASHSADLHRADGLPLADAGADAGASAGAGAAQDRFLTTLVCQAGVLEYLVPRRMGCWFVSCSSVHAVLKSVDHLWANCGPVHRQLQGVLGAREDGYMFGMWLLSLHCTLFVDITTGMLAELGVRQVVQLLSRMVQDPVSVRTCAVPEYNWVRCVGSSALSAKILWVLLNDEGGGVGVSAGAGAGGCGSSAAQTYQPKSFGCF